MSAPAVPLGVIAETDVEIPMRDGVILRANIFRPEGPGKFPALLERTPYGKKQAAMERYVRAGYVVATQDTRGRHASDGEFTVFTEPETPDGDDGVDTIEWLARQSWCDGRVALMGASYCAWMAWMAARRRPPSLAAMSVRSIPTELWEVDYSGSFRPARRVQWWLCTIGSDMRRRAGMPPPHTPAEAREIWMEIERGRRLETLPWIEIVRYLPAPLSHHVESWLREPRREPWRFREAHADVEVPNLDLSGYYDHCNGTIGHFHGMRENGRTEAARRHTRLILGPWNHPGIGARTCGDVDFGPQAEVDLIDLNLRWFDHFIKGVDNGVGDEPAVRYFVMGAGRWKSADDWPPPGTTETALYLDSDEKGAAADGRGALRLEPPAEAGTDVYLYDPWDPTPTLWTPALFTGPSDRRRLFHRRDLLYYRTPPLDRPVEVAGCPVCHLHAASSAPDADFFARLIDEPPDGPALDVCCGMVRARHRNGLDREDLLEPGEIVEYEIEMGPTAIRFERGHRITLEIASADFPNHDRNHSAGKNDLTDATLALARQTIHHSPARPSRLVLPVDER